MGGIYVDQVTAISVDGEPWGGDFAVNIYDAGSLEDNDTDYTVTLFDVPDLTTVTIVLDIDAYSFQGILTEEVRTQVEVITVQPDVIPLAAMPGGGSYGAITPAAVTPGGETDKLLVVMEFVQVIEGPLFSIEISASEVPGDTDTIHFVMGSSPTEFSITCFAPGTGVATPQGERAVERLRPGDPILTADGRTVPVKWIGRQTRNKLFTPEDRLRPVRVSAGALGPVMPHTDLVLTADHALIIDGMAINAGALVNGTTITLDPIAALDYSVTYYHVETEEHDVILANGVPAETFIDYVSRRTFDNFAGFAAFCDAADVVTEMDMPRISAARLVPPEIRARLARRAAA